MGTIPRSSLLFLLSLIFSIQTLLHSSGAMAADSSPDAELRRQVLTLYEEEDPPKSECRLAGPHCTAQRALDACGAARQRTDRDGICREAQQKYDICMAFVEDWRARKAAVLARVDAESPGLGQDYTEGVSDLRGLGQQRNAEQMWNDTIKALRNMDIRNCPGFVTGTWMTPLEALAAWDQEDNTGVPVEKDPFEMVLEEPGEKDLAQQPAEKPNEESGSAEEADGGTDEEPNGAAGEAEKAGYWADEGSAGESTGGPSDPVDETDPVAVVPGDGTEPGSQAAAAPQAPRPAMRNEDLDALLSHCASSRHATLLTSGLVGVHIDEAEAPNCVEPRGDIPPNGGFFNKCDFEVEVATCLYRPFAGTPSMAVNCEAGRHQVLRLPPHQGRPGFTTDAELIYYTVCRVPGYSLFEYGPFIPGYGMQMRCEAWPGTEDPAAAEARYGGDCSNENLERLSGLSIPPPQPAAPPAAEVWQPPEFSSSEELFDSPRESYDDSYDSYDSYEDQGYSEPDTGQIITDAAMQMMNIYLQQQGTQSSGSGGYQDKVCPCSCTASEEICEELERDGYLCPQWRECYYD